MKLKAFILIALFANNVFAIDRDDRKKLILAADYWCPYNCHPDSELPGFLVEVLSRSLHIYGIDIEYRMMPWRKAMDALVDGEVDGVIGISDIKGNKLVTTRLPLDYSSISAFTRSDIAWVYDGVGSLRGKKLGFVMDYVIDEAISHYIGSNYPSHPDWFMVQDGKNAVIESIADLMDGYSDVYIEDARVVERYLSENALTAIKNAGIVSKNKVPIYVAFSSKIPSIHKYIKHLEEGIASLKATGEYDDIREKYQMDKEIELKHGL